MSQKTKSVTLQKGFSLIELIIVIFIVSLVYYLGFSGVELGKQKPKPLTLLNLKKNIEKSEFFSDHATLMCLDKCRACYLRRDISSPFETYTNPIDLGDIKVYTLDESESLKRIEYERYHDKKICLFMDFYDNGSSTKIIIENEEGSYLLPAFFGETLRFDSPEEAKEYWLKSSDAVSDGGDFY